MNLSDAASGPEQSPIYRLAAPTNIMGFALPAIALVMASSIAWMTLTVFADQPVACAILLLGALIVLVVGVLMGAGVQRIGIRLTAHSLVFYALGYMVEAPWSQVKLKDVGSGTRLVLENPTVVMRPWFQSLMRLQVPIILLGALSGRVHMPVNLDRPSHEIPVQAFSPTWPDGAFARALKTYAPRLFA